MSANTSTAAPSERKKLAQGKEPSDAALGHASQNASSDEGANEGRDQGSKIETGAELLARLLTSRRKEWQGRGKYKEPAAPDTTNLPKLPVGWTWATADQLTSVITDGEHITPQRADSGILLLSARNVLDGRISLDDVDYVPRHEYDRIAKRLVIAPGDVLLSCSGSVGRSAVVPEGLLFTLVRSVAVLKPLAGMGKYLSTALRAPLLKQQITEKQTQTAQANIFQGKIKVLCFPLAPLPEQRRIVAEIEKQFTRLEAGVAALRRVQANLKRYRAAVLKAACEGQLVTTKTTWPQKQIATAIQTMDQGWSPKCESEPSDNNATWAVIKTTAIQNLRFVEVENKKLPPSLKPRPHLELQSGDLLVTRAGPRNRVGVACLVKSTRPRLMLCDKAYRLRCKSDVAAPAFLELVLNAPHIVDEVNKLKTGISDSGVNLTQKRFGELLVPLPALAEQTRIVAEVERRLSVVEELESVVTANLQRATRLRQSILQKAFTGGLV